MTQLSFYDARNDLEEKYRTWLSTHQAVFALFEKFAMQMVERRRHFGIGMLAERVRWEVRTTWEQDEDGYKINNNHRAYISRDLLAKYPEMAPYLKTRTVRGEEEEE